MPDFKKMMEEYTQTDVGKELRDLLYQVCNDDEFVCGGLFIHYKHGTQKKLLDFIKSGHTDYDSVMKYSFDLTLK